MSQHADFYNGLNLHGTEIQNFKPHEVTSLPLSPFLGQTVFLTVIDGTHDANTTYQYDGTEWRSITHHDLTVAQSSANYLQINGHEIGIKSLLMHDYIYDDTYATLTDWITGYGYTGTELEAGDELYLAAATDGAKAYKHNGGVAGTADDFFIVTDALTDAEIRGKFKGGAGTTYDSTAGSYDVNTDGQTLSINGSDSLYIVDGGVDSLQIATGAVITDKLATDSVTTAKISNLNVTEDKLSAAVTNKLNDSYAETIGNASATTFTITHSLNTRDLVISIADTSDDYKSISPAAVGCKRPTLDTITLDFGSTQPAVGQFRIVIKKAV